jgi:serine protease Do
MNRGRLARVASAAVLLALFVPAEAALRAQDGLPAEELAAVKAAEEARIRAIEKVYETVVAVYGRSRQGGGSGVVYDPAGYALTNYHVVAAAGDEGLAGLADGRLYPWKLVGIDPGGDLAIIKLEGRDEFPFAALGDSDRVRVGEFAMAMGNPFVLAEDQRPTVTLGIVSGVRRFQGGQPNNMLVYGNCIQVDSSINPGNSGGPLFNMAGEVIGINGRGSFRERGRVNVGVGYAISIKQAKNFLPELLATKIALHGTLDAVFSNRSGGVVCSQLNLDSPIAKAGLQLGDRLISFDGEAIRDANELTNLVSTLPAGWPVDVVYERDDRQHTAWVRLTPLPYGPLGKQQPKQPPRPAPKPEPKPDAPQDAPEDAPDKVEEPPVPPPPAEPGKIRDMNVNQVEALRIVESFVRFVGGRDAIEAAPAYRFDEQIVRDGKEVGRQETLVAIDGRWRVRSTIADFVREYGFDGAGYWHRRGDGPAESLEIEQAWADPHAAQAGSLAVLLARDGLKRLAHYELQGADKAQRQRAYRLRAVASDRHDLYFWFSIEDEAGRPAVRLLKTAGGAAGRELDPQVTYADYRRVGAVLLPHRRQFVEGLPETVRMELVAASCEAVQELPADAFKPEGEKR